VSTIREQLEAAKALIFAAQDGPDPVYACALCQDRGFILSETEGRRAAATCECRRRAALESSLRKAGLPQRYQEASLLNFDRAASPAATVGLQAAKRFVEAWPLTPLPGLLLTGTVGTGKTHLTVAILRTLVMGRGAIGRFVDFGSLLKQLRSSYGENASLDEAEILRPVLQCDVLALDEIGAQKPSDWVSDVIEHILNTRYNEHRTTLITTNLPFREPAGTRFTAEERSTPLQLGESLGDRVGMRMFSRLQEMCEVIEMNGADYRAKARQRRTA
jgi:DNA replication protein DnaC